MAIRSGRDDGSTVERRRATSTALRYAGAAALAVILVVVVVAGGGAAATASSPSRGPRAGSLPLQAGEAPLSPDLNHLHLHVRDVARSRAFYEGWFGVAELRAGDPLFLRNGDGFDLALAPDPEPAALPRWFHVGFQLASADEVRDLHGRMRAAGVALRTDLVEEVDTVSFKCEDPDGLAVEVCWE